MLGSLARLGAGPVREILLGEENMRSLTTFFLMVWLCIAPASLAQAQSKEPADKNDSAATSATKEEVEQLRSEVAAQRQTIEELDRKSTRLNSSHLVISYAVFCLKKKKK